MARRITFPELQPQFVVDRDCVSFPAQAGEARFKCLVTVELLMERFGARGPSEEEALRAYERHKEEIRVIARALIERGEVNSDGEVLITSRTFRLKKVVFGEKLQQNRELFFLARKATERLEEVVGTSAWSTEAEWDRGEDSKGRCIITLRLTDWTGSVTGLFEKAELESPSQTRYRLLRLWGDLLQIRSHKQLENLLEGAAPAET